MCVWLCVAVQDKAPVFGVVHVPVTGQTYYAVAGKGAYLRERDGSTRQIHCKEFAIGQPNLVVVGSASHANPTNNSGRGQPVCLLRPSCVFAAGLATVCCCQQLTLQWHSQMCCLEVKHITGSSIAVMVQALLLSL